MCGIAGIVDLKGTREIDRAALARMSAALIHRGPDGDGEFIAPGIGLAHRRLAIIDIDGGTQPYRVKGGVLSYNGEIYNHRALAKALSARHGPLETRSDTEVLAVGLKVHGTDFLNEIRGMFAFAFWDHDTQSLMLARDRLGEKPLFYGETFDGFLVFASELSALCKSGMLSREISPDAIADYFFYGYVPDPKTIYGGIKKLEPGHFLMASVGRAIRIEQYWRPHFSPDEKLGFDAASDMLRSSIDGSVERQLMSDVPLGAFLSGGVDSAGIVAAMAQAGVRPVTCTVGFREESHDERAGAGEIAKRFATTHYEHEVSLDASELVDKIASMFGEPFADASALPSYLVASLARQHVSVALSGDGGDELFAGYRRYPFFLGEERIRRMLPGPLRQVFFGPAGAVYPKLDWAPRRLRAKTTLQSLALSQSNAYAHAVAINLPACINAVFSPDFHRSLGDYDPREIITRAMGQSDSDDPLARAQYADFKTWLPGRMLTKVDRTSMANGLEVRPPFLDIDVVDLAGRFPSRFKLDYGTGKRILKSALLPRLGADYIARPKRGFGVPLDDWFRDETSALANRLKTSPHWHQSGFLNVEAVETLLASHQARRQNCGQELWSVLMFDAFLKQAG